MSSPFLPSPTSADPTVVPPAALSSAPTLDTILHALRRSWKIVLPIALLLALGAAGLTWVLMSGQYTSQIVFRIHPRPVAGSLEDEGNFAGVQKAQVSVLTSQDVLSKAIERSKVQELYGVEYTPQQLQKQLVTNFNSGPELLVVQLTSRHPEAGTAILVALGEVFTAHVQAADETRVRSRIAQLRRRLTLDAAPAAGRPPTLAEEIRDKRTELRLAEQKYGLQDHQTLGVKIQIAQSILLGLQKDYRDKVLQRASLEADLAAKEALVTRPPTPMISESEAEESLRGDPAYQELARDIGLKKKEISNIQSTVAEEVRAQRLEKPLAELAQLEQVRWTMVEETRRKLAARTQRQLIENEKRAILELRDRIENARKLEAALEKEVRRAADELEKLRLSGPSVPPEIESLRDQLKQLEKEYARVGDELASLEGALPIVPRVTVHAPAVVPSGPDMSRPMKYSAAAGVAVFGLAVAGLCLLEARRRRVSSPEDMVQGLGLAVVGTLPRLPPGLCTKLQPTPIALGGPEVVYGMIEAVDVIRTVLLHGVQHKTGCILLVTSATSGEGKSTLACHLAASLARVSRSTLLIDGDLRNPRLHELFQLPLSPGLSEVLRNDCDIGSAIHPTTTGWLSLLPAGEGDVQAVAALSDAAIGHYFAHLKERYDFIVIDSSPVLPVPDALLLGQLADMVLLSVMKDVSRLPLVYQAYRRLVTLGIRVLGSVVVGDSAVRYGREMTYPPPGHMRAISARTSEPA